MLPVHSLEVDIIKVAVVFTDQSALVEDDSDHLQGTAELQPNLESQL